jgi:hypothetical protein
MSISGHGLQMRKGVHAIDYVVRCPSAGFVRWSHGCTLITRSKRAELYPRVCNEWIVFHSTNMTMILDGDRTRTNRCKFCNSVRCVWSWRLRQTVRCRLQRLWRNNICSRWWSFNDSWGVLSRFCTRDYKFSSTDTDREWHVLKILDQNPYRGG